jgi:cytoskeletal protein CcmA (bactofilin family)
MLGMGRREGSVEVKPQVKNVLSQTQTRPANMPINTATSAAPPRSSMPNAALPHEPSPPPMPRDLPPAPASRPQTVEPVATSVAETPGSKLFVGPNIKLKGVEISDCDVLVVEGHGEATVHSKGLQIAQPGTLNGTVTIDVAEIYGEFSGELTARTRLVVHGTGRVSGKIRYGKLIVEEGGELTGDVRQIDGAEDHPQLALTPAGEPRTSGNVASRVTRETAPSTN